MRKRTIFNLAKNVRFYSDPGYAKWKEQANIEKSILGDNEEALKRCYEVSMSCKEYAKTNPFRGCMAGPYWPEKEIKEMVRKETREKLRQAKRLFPK